MAVNSEGAKYLADMGLRLIGVDYFSVSSFNDLIQPHLTLLDRGIILTGGGALLKNLDVRLREDTSMAIHIADDPLTCVARGCGNILNDPERFEKVLLKARRNV